MEAAIVGLVAIALLVGLGVVSRDLRRLDGTLRHVEKALNQLRGCVDTRLRLGGDAFGKDPRRALEAADTEPAAFGQAEGLRSERGGAVSANTAGEVVEVGAAEPTTNEREVPPEPQPVEYSEAAVRGWYAGWCATGEPPLPNPWIEVVPMWYVAARQASELDLPVHRLEDADAIVSEWVRFAPLGGGQGLLLPHPNAFRSSGTLRRLFGPAAAAAEGDRAALATLEPVRIRRTPEGEWETCPE